MSHHRTFLRAFCVLSLTSSPLFAEWDKPENSPIAIKSLIQNITIDSDGSFTSEEVVTREILQAGAKDQFGTFNDSFNSASANLISLQAWTINGNKTIEVPKKNIEVNTASNDEPGFDRRKKIVAAFPSVEVHSLLKTKAVYRYHTVPVPGHYSRTFSLPSAFPVSGYEAHIKSRLPLNFQADGLPGYLQITSQQSGGYYHLDIKQVKPGYFDVVREPRSYFYKSPTPSVAVSTDKDWAVINGKMVKNFESVLSEPMPKLVADEVSRIKNQHKTLVDQANAFTNFLAETHRYMGDWRTVKGGYQPRHLAEIVSSRFGDCKDFATITAKALRALGYEAHVAAVYRSSMPPSLPALPAVNAFDHVVVRVTDKDGKILWIDPTNPNSFAHGQREDIAERTSLVFIDQTKPLLDTIPGLTTEGESSGKSVVITNENISTAKVNFLVSFNGRAAQGITGAELHTTHDNIADQIVSMVAKQGKVLSSQISPFDLKSRTVSDQTLAGEVRYLQSLDQNSYGYGLPLPAFQGDLQTLDIEKRVSDYYLTSSPYRNTEETTIKQATAPGDLPLQRQLTSKWFDVSRTIEQRGSDLYVSQKITMKKRYILRSEMETEEFLSMRQALRRDFGKFSVIYTTTDPLAEVYPDDAVTCSGEGCAALAH